MLRFPLSEYGNRYGNEKDDARGTVLYFMRQPEQRILNLLSFTITDRKFLPDLSPESQSPHRTADWQPE